MGPFKNDIVLGWYAKIEIGKSGVLFSMLVFCADNLRWNPAEAFSFFL